MKRLKKYSIVIFCLACALIVSVACSKQETTPEDTFNGSTTRVPINLRSGAGTASIDKQIKTIRLIFFTSTGGLVSNWLYNAPSGDNPSIITGEMTLGMNNIYVICNETPELGRDLAKVTRPEQIASIRFTPPVDGITDPVPMFCHLPDVKIERGNGKAVNVTIGTETKPYLEVTVKRIVAKIGMTVIKNVPTDEVDFSIEKLSYKICRVPAYSMLSEEDVRYPQGEGWGADIKVEGQGRIAANSNGEYVVSGDAVSTNPTNLDAIHCPAVYIPEHKPQIPENPDYCTYLLIEADCKTQHSSTPIRSVYRINMGKLPPTDLSIERNVNYQVYVKITGLGSMGIYAEIVPFTEYHHPVEWTPFEGYTIVSELATEYGKNTNVWNDYSQYSGILKITKDKSTLPALFRYGSLTAIGEGTLNGAFNAATDVLWRGNLAAVAGWDEITYQSTGPIEHTLQSVKQGKGDPCRLVGLTLDEIKNGKIDNELWRMPTTDEMEWLNTARNTEVKTEGFYSFHSMITPKNGYREIDGMMVPATTEGRYWNATEAKSFAFSTVSNSKLTTITDDPKNAYGVRCIRTIMHDSRFTIVGANVPWTGGSISIARITERYLVPFWRVVPLSADLDGISYSVLEGGSEVSAASAIVFQLDDPYKGRVFTLTAHGYGLDGVVHTSVIEVNQLKLTHSIVVELMTQGLSFENGFLRIPKEGATLKFKASITPALHLPYVLADLKWRIVASWYNNQWHTQQGTEATFFEESTVTFPPNEWGHIINAEAVFGWVTTESDRPPCSSYGKVRFIQQT